MKFLPALLLGPELLWLLFFLSVKGLIRFTGSPRKQMDRLWLSLANFVPFIAIPMTFALYHFPGVPYSWLLLRIWISCVLGAHFVLDRGLAAHSEQGPGVGTAYIMGMILSIGMLAVGSVVLVVIWYL
jgi:hypothetical protein